MGQRTDQAAGAGRQDARMQPIVLFDKSFVEMLNVDEAAVFDALYSSVICPIFYTEVLADLSKEPPGERTAERIVADVAKKTPIMRSRPNALHSSLCLTELVEGYAIEMRRVPVVAGGRAVRKADGTLGIIYDEAPEAKAFDRWQSSRFDELERDFARCWRAQLESADHAAVAKLAKQELAIHASPKDLAEALAIAKNVVRGDGQRFRTLKTAYALLGLPSPMFPKVRDRWIRLGRPHLTDFAPYTAHCLLIDVFFHVAVDKRLIAPERASNRVDIAYLYYLPFTMVFVSNDKLHGRTASLFLGDDQLFVTGEDLKRDLMALDAYYSARPESERAQGLFRLAGYPPQDDAFLTTRIWKRFGMPTQRPPEDVDPAETLPKGIVDKLLAAVGEMKEARNSGVEQFSRSEWDDATHVVTERRFPLQRGKWRLLPPGFEAKAE
jgi:hypothetical protein